MENIKGIAIVTDGSQKRIAVTYDEINDEGEIIKPNVRVNRVIMNENAKNAVSILEDYAKQII